MGELSRWMAATSAILITVVVAGCDTLPTDTDASSVVAFAKGGQNSTTERIDVTITDLTPGLRSDDEGTYIDQDCGVWAWMDGVAFMNPDAARIPKADQQRCGDGRYAWANLDGVDYELINIHLRADDPANPTSAVGTVNASTLCVFVGPSGRTSGKGLRFNPDDFPGSDPLNVEKLSDTSWRFWTSPYPDNKGWCEDDTGIHIVNFDLDVTVAIQDPS